MSTLTLYSMPSSGNSYKVRLMLALLGRPYARHDVEANAPELRAAQSAGALPNGTAPALHLPDGTILSESGAILWYLAEGTPWIPEAALARAETLAWMFFEQNRLEPVIAVRASLRSYAHLADEATPEALARLLARGLPLLARMERALSEAPYFGGTNPTIADIALYGYTHSAGSRGGYDMRPYPNLTAWCARIASLPGYIGLGDRP